MRTSINLAGLQIETALGLQPYSQPIPSTWPPLDTFPIVTDANGAVVCCFGDREWDLSAWHGQRLVLRFGDGPTRGEKVSHPNAVILRTICAWWLWGPVGCRTAGTLNSKYELIKPIFVVCTTSGICATDLYKYPKVIEALLMKISRSRGTTLIAILTELFAARRELGFVIPTSPRLQ